jgi:hypothetical protein
MANNRRPQTTKDTLDKRFRAEVDRARSNAAGPHPSKAKYSRKDKHKGKQDWR